LNFFHSGGVGLLTRGSSSMRECFGNKGVVRLGVIETMRGNCDEDVADGDGVSDGGSGTSMGSSTIMGGGSYCSIDKYCRRCCPQGTKGSGGVTTRDGDSTSGGLGEIGMGTNGDGSTIGGDGVLGTMGGSGITSLGRDDDGWMNGRITGGGLTGSVGAIAGADDGASGMTIFDPPVPPEGLGLGVNTGDGDLLLNILLQPLRSVRSLSRNV